MSAPDIGEHARDIKYTELFNIYFFPNGIFIRKQFGSSFTGQDNSIRIV